MLKQVSVMGILVCLFLVAGCAKKTSSSETSSVRPADYVAVTLSAAAEQAHAELAMVARLRGQGQGFEFMLPAADPNLDKLMSISWTGPAEGALKEICLQTGYRYQELGKPSAQSLVVVVHGLNRSAQNLLEDIAWQVQPQATVKVDSLGRVITLARHETAGSK